LSSLVREKSTSFVILIARDLFHDSRVQTVVDPRRCAWNCRPVVGGRRLRKAR
jgi:hypothetical protein